MADTGQGASVTLATTGSVGAVRSITLPEFVIEALEDHDLSTTGFKTKIPTDLADPGEVTLEILWDNSVNTEVPSIGVAETVTVTWPIVTSTNTTAGKLEGTGFISSVKLPDMNTGELQVATITVMFDGKTDPAFTPEGA